MSEKIQPSRRDGFHIAQAIIATGLAAELLSACSGTDYNSAKTSLHTCDSDSYIFSQGSHLVAPAASSILAEASADIILLRQRALQNGGELNTPDHKTTEVKVTHTGVNFVFPAGRQADLPGENDVLQVPIKNGHIVSTPSTFLCTGHGGVYINSAFKNIEHYVQETAQLSR